MFTTVRPLVIAAALATLPVALPLPAVASTVCVPSSSCLLDRTWHLNPSATSVEAVAKHGVLSLTVRSNQGAAGYSASLNDGCNGMGANLRLHPARPTITFEYFHSTPRFCDDVSNAAENALARALGNATVTYAVTNSTLVLHTAEGDLAFRSSS